MKAIDAHFYYGKFYFPEPEMTLDRVLKQMREYDIEKTIMMSCISILQDFEEGNHVLFRDIEGHDNLYGYCFINGNYLDKSIAEMRRYLPLPNCKGVKYHPEYSGKRPDDADVLPLFETLARKYKKPALIHSWPFGEHGNPTPNSHPRFIAELARRLPELKILMGHMGGPEWTEAIEIAKPYPNLYLDIQGSYTDYDKIRVAVDALGANRVLFGSGMAPAAPLGAVHESNITEEQKQTVLYYAAKKLFDL